MPNVLPEIVFVADDAQDDELTKRVLSRLPGVEVKELGNQSDPYSEHALPEVEEAERFSLGKRALVLRRHKGAWLDHCPGTKDHVCCNLWTVNPGEGCPFDCTYCFLQSYLKRNPAQKIFTNTGDMLAEIRSALEKEPSRYFRICTGEVIDSLAWDPLTDSSLELVPFFARCPNATLELKTKSSNIANLLAQSGEHAGKTVVSWSVNAPLIVAGEEALTASLRERLKSAQAVSEAGYRAGFHFDPLIYFEGWEDEYRETIRLIFEHVLPRDIAWISIATLRYQPQMQGMMRQRFPKSKLPYGEQFVGPDGKFRYIQPIRFKMLRFMWDELKAVSPDLPVYMCMESAAAWREIHGGPPDSGLIEIFSRRRKPA